MVSIANHTVALKAKLEPKQPLCMATLGKYLPNFLLILMLLWLIMLLEIQFLHSASLLIYLFWLTLNFFNQFDLFHPTALLILLNFSYNYLYISIITGLLKQH